MRKLNFFALLLALVLLLSATACKKDVTDGDLPPSAADAETAGGAGAGDENGEGTLDADDFKMEMGYPLGFTLRMTGESGYGFDTASKQVFCGTEQKPCDLSAKLSALYGEMTEHDIYNLCATGDLTYKAISGNDYHELNESYELVFTENGTTYSVKTDKAALLAYATRSDISNLSGLIRSFSNLARLHFG
jgi:hypothetical protein